MNQINSSQIVGLAAASFQQHFKFLLSISVVFVGITTAMLLVLASLMTSVVMIILGFILLVAVYAKLAVMVHRAVLLEETQWSALWRWSNEELAFTLKIIGLGLVAMVAVWLTLGTVAAGPGSSTGAIWFVLFLMIGLGVVFSRVVLILPATAVGHSLSLGESWHLTQNNKLSMFFLVIVFPYLTSRLLDQLPVESLIGVILIQLITVLVTVFEVTMISHCYERLTAEEGIDDSDGEEAPSQNDVVM